ncbi:hypothetical protein PAAG_01774 [Paracoccidioides lutzii Pb01]|uniref:Uncharacterized protein n=1 Tax=Paracoccidioides lutzii (strain ATCC MYA-826 / Pb01) TaxID=502779 RepID=C1GTC9_PARBA|nr:hypothetical protein PAAG_01774 [Paracoccidioides lutzii Pb01]EEH39312.2 hypothetical protein PAAG_01774 [Paracoccidioides lutzii Pb01]
MASQADSSENSSGSITTSISSLSHMEPGSIYLQRLPSGKPAFIRRSKRIKTPGALLADALFNPHSSPLNYLPYLVPDHNRFGAASSPEPQQVPVIPYEQLQQQPYPQHFPQKLPQPLPVTQTPFPNDMTQVAPFPPYAYQAVEELTKSDKNETVLPAPQAFAGGAGSAIAFMPPVKTAVVIAGRRSLATKKSTKGKCYTSDNESDRAPLYTVQPSGSGVYDPNRCTVNLSNHRTSGVYQRSSDAQIPQTLYANMNDQFTSVQRYPTGGPIYHSCGNISQPDQYVHSHCFGNCAAIPIFQGTNATTRESSPRTYYYDNRRAYESSVSVGVEPQGHIKGSNANDECRRRDHVPPMQPGCSQHPPCNTQYVHDNRTYSTGERERIPGRESKYSSYSYARDAQRDNPNRSPECYTRRERSSSRRSSYSRHRPVRDFNSRHDEYEVPQMVEIRGRRSSR